MGTLRKNNYHAYATIRKIKFVYRIMSRFLSLLSITELRDQVVFIFPHALRSIIREYIGNGFIDYLVGVKSIAGTVLFQSLSSQEGSGIDSWLSIFSGRDLEV
jgi:hypothetical protein